MRGPVGRHLLGCYPEAVELSPLEARENVA